MSVRIRLRRVGATKRPIYRVVVADSTSPRDGRFIETIGQYNPLVQPHELVVKAERIQYWMSQGAKPSDAVVKLLQRGGYLPSSATEPAEASADVTPSIDEAAK